MFTVYHSNKLDTLKILLVNLIRIEPLADPFEAEQILVQSPGMSQWLKMELAKEFGVAANVSFPLPATFIWDVFTQLLPDVPKQSAFNKSAMTWKLVSLLPELCDEPEFLPIKHYLAQEDSALNLYQLAEKIADIFDSYLVYRPDWIEQWENREGWDSVAESHRWQPILWYKLYQYTLSLGQSHYHRANLYQALLERLQDPSLSFTGLPKRLFIFGITALPPRYMEALQALGEQIEIHLMLTNPCQYYWGDIRDRKYLLHMENKKWTQWSLNHAQPLNTGKQSPVLKGSVEDNIQDDALHIKSAVGNSLLASLGKQARDNLQLLTQMNNEEHAIFVDVDRDNLLHQLQADILNLEEHAHDELLNTSAHKQTVQPDDHSLTVHSCHSATREVEVLHDHLLYLLDHAPHLQPRDVIVMVADIDAYSAAIQAVFGSAPSERFIPYSISDRTADKESPLLGAFLHLLNLPHSRCLASELLELLELPAMLKRFGLTEDSFSQVKQWIEESGIRWGLNGVAVAEFDVPANKQNTWEFGIERMLTGYAMVDSVGLFESPHDSIAPYNEVQGLNAELAGKLAAFIDRIHHYRHALSQSLPIEIWQQTLADLLDDFFALSLDEEVVLENVRDSIAALKEQLVDVNYQHPIDADVLRYCLHQKLTTSRVSQRFLAGQVNFCTLMPMRSIPFKVVCLLGMNDGAYPRNSPLEGFDLMSSDYRPGDRSRRDDDRYLFLEALLSAQEHLYISYIGQSNRDNTVLTPSVLVTELMEYCQQNYCLVGDETLNSDASGVRLVDALCTQHSMMPYSPSAFSVAPGSYAKEWIPVVQRLKTSQMSESVVERDVWKGQEFPYELDLVELQRFWHLPVRYFFNRRLKVSLELSNFMLNDDEPFALNGLQSYQLTEELLAQMLSSPLVDEHQQSLWMKSQQAQGKLPMGAFGELEFNQHVERAKQLAEPIRVLCQEPLDDVELSLTFCPEPHRSIQLMGWLRNRYQSGIVQYRPGKIRAQDYLSAWINHLAWATVQPGLLTHLVGFDKQSGVNHWVLPPIIDHNMAMEHLTRLVTLFYTGMNQPLPYFPKTALACIESAMTKSGWKWDEDKALKAMTDVFKGNFFSAGEGGNSYIQRIWPEWDTSLADDVKALAFHILHPLRTQVIPMNEYLEQRNMS